jgi:hypothetical protein
VSDEYGGEEETSHLMCSPVLNLSNRPGMRIDTVEEVEDSQNSNVFRHHSSGNPSRRYEENAFNE